MYTRHILCETKESSVHVVPMMNVSSFEPPTKFRTNKTITSVFEPNNFIATPDQEPMTGLQLSHDEHTVYLTIIWNRSLLYQEYQSKTAENGRNRLCKLVGTSCGANASILHTSALYVTVWFSR